MKEEENEMRTITEAVFGVQVLGVMIFGCECDIGFDMVRFLVKL